MGDRFRRKSIRLQSAITHPYGQGYTKAESARVVEKHRARRPSEYPIERKDAKNTKKDEKVVEIGKKD